MSQTANRTEDTRPQPDADARGIVFDIQFYAIYDGPGIRSCVFLKGCPLKCEWCHNPESQAAAAQMSYFAEKCAACGGCINACSSGALTLNGKTVVRDMDKCVVCGACADACPNQAMERIGKETLVHDIVERVLPDKPFYDNSGGGVTISGGEATVQPDFLLALLAQLKAADVHTAIETCGFFNPGMLPKLLENTDLFLYDIKHADPEKHKQHTGVTTERIAENFRALLEKAPERVVARIPLIPGFNTDEADLAQISGFLKECGYTGPVHLMPYNPMAKTKWEKIGRGGEYKRLADLTDQDLERIKTHFQKVSFDVVVNG